MFCPNGETLVITPSVLSERYELPAYNAETGAVRIRIGGNASVYIKFGNSSVEVDAGDMLISSGNSETFRIPSGVTHIAVLSAVTVISGVLNLTVGQDI